MTSRWSKLTEGDYGFAWGPLEVTRMSVFRDTGVVRVSTETGAKINIYVSKTGRSLRVFRDGKELK
jgi:hypothetical protein